MVMPSAGTFQYKAIVPAKFDECSWPVQLDQPVVHTGDSLHDSRLVGACPCLQITDGGPTPNPSSSRPEVLKPFHSCCFGETKRQRLFRIVLCG
jgi:hypothetical protein